MKKNTIFLFVIMLSLLFAFPAQAQLGGIGGKIKDKIKGNKGQKQETESAPQEVNPKKLKVYGENEVGNEFQEDEYGIAGVYYYSKVNEPNARYKALVKSLTFCEDFAKKVVHKKVPSCFTMAMEYSAHNSSGTIRTHEYEYNATNYNEVGNLIDNKMLVISTYRGSWLQLAPGVLFTPPSNAAFGTSEAPEEAITDYVFSSGFIYAKNQDDIAEWSDIEKIREAYKKASEAYKAIRTEYEGAQTASVEMPSISTLNTKAIQEQALKAYNAKYNSVNKGWTSNYMYVYGDKWATITHKVHGHILYRQIAVVIARTNPEGKCKADLMNFVEPYENGQYVASKGYISGPISYVGMPGGYLPCEKMDAFKSKLK